MLEASDLVNARAGLRCCPERAERGRGLVPARCDVHVLEHLAGSLKGLPGFFVLAFDREHLA